jgi:hypothetical protein
MKACKKAYEFLGLLPKTSIDINFDQTRAIISDEFNRPELPHSGGDYRWRAVRRLIALCVPWRTETNIAYEVVKQFVSVKCPYCKEDMKIDNSSGCGHSQTISFCCNGCKAIASMTIDNESFMSFHPFRTPDEAKDIL